jgi:hypothetical protein
MERQQGSERPRCYKVAQHTAVWLIKHAQEMLFIIIIITTVHLKMP